MKGKLVTPYRVRISTVTMLRQQYDTSQLDCAKHWIWKVCIRHVIVSEQGPDGKAGGNKRATIRTGDYTKPTPPPICILKDVLWGRELDFCLLHCLAKQVSLYRIVWVRMDKWVKHFKDVNWRNWGLISQNVSDL